MNNIQRLALILALLFTGLAVWTISWTFLYPSFQLMYWQQYGEWTPTTFQNYLVMSISGMYVVGFALIAWKGEQTQTILSELSPWPDPGPRKSETGLTSNKLCSSPQAPTERSYSPPSSLSGPSSVSSPQLSELFVKIEEIGKRMDGIVQSQKKLTPFLGLAPQQEEGDK